MKRSPSANSEQIRLLNDSFRHTFVGGRVMITPCVEDLDVAVRNDLLLHVREFSAFDGNNDPYGEHDFGAVTVGGQSFFWKIDYYDRALEGGSDDPANADKTIRVLTIMHASEY